MASVPESMQSPDRCWCWATWQVEQYQTEVIAESVSVSMAEGHRKRSRSNRPVFHSSYAKIANDASSSTTENRTLRGTTTGVVCLASEA